MAPGSWNASWCSAPRLAGSLSTASRPAVEPPKERRCWLTSLGLHKYKESELTAPQEPLWNWESNALCTFYWFEKAYWLAFQPQASVAPYLLVTVIYWTAGLQYPDQSWVSISLSPRAFRGLELSSFLEEHLDTEDFGSSSVGQYCPGRYCTVASLNEADSSFNSAVDLNLNWNLTQFSKVCCCCTLTLPISIWPFESSIFAWPRYVISDISRSHQAMGASL